MVEISTSGSERAQGEIPWATYSGPAARRTMRWNGSRHFELRATPQMGRICDFQAYLSIGGIIGGGGASSNGSNALRPALRVMLAINCTLIADFCG